MLARLEVPPAPLCREATRTLVSTAFGCPGIGSPEAPSLAAWPNSANMRPAASKDRSAAGHKASFCPIPGTLAPFPVSAEQSSCCSPCPAALARAPGSLYGPAKAFEAPDAAVLEALVAAPQSSQPRAADCFSGSLRMAGKEAAARSLASHAGNPEVLPGAAAPLEPSAHRRRNRLADRISALAMRAGVPTGTSEHPQGAEIFQRLDFEAGGAASC